MNDVIEDGDRLPVSTSKYLDVLEAVLAIVALAGGVGQVLGPDQDGVSGATWLDQYFLPLMALDHELRFVEVLTLQVVHVDRTVGLVL